MHKKHSKLNHKDHHHSSSRKIQKCKKDSTDTRLDVPQNSRSDVNKKLAVESGTKENSKYKHKHKHKTSEEGRGNDHHGKSKHNDKLVYNVSDIQGLVLDKEVTSHKEKKEKRDKERLNKIEKYLEGLDKVCTKKTSHNRSHSLGSSETVFKNQDVSFRREKTFHEKLKRHASTNSRINISTEKYSDHATHRRKSGKKHKHQNKERESSKEKNTKDTSISYFQVETENPFLHKKKKYDVERLYPEESHIINERSSRRHSSSKDSYSSPQTKLEPTPKYRKERNRESVEKRRAPIKFSPRRSKLKTDLKNYKDERSNTSLGPYRKYFAFDRKSQERESAPHKKKRHRKVDSVEKVIENAEKEKIEKKPEKSQKKNQERVNSQPDQYKEKIEDDIKSYFTRIQSLIDKKLDFILGNSNSKETKSSSMDNEPVVEKIKNKKHKKEEIEDEKLRDRNYSKKKKNEKLDTTPVERKSKHSEEVTKLRYSEEKKANVENRRLKNTHNTSSTSLKRERYPSADSGTQKRRPSPSARWPYDDYPPPRSNNDTRQEKRNKSPYREPKESKMRPDQLINMLENPSTFSLHSKPSATKPPVEEELRHRSYQHQRGDSANENIRRRGRSTARSDAISNEDNFKFKEFQQAYLQEAHTKKMKKRVAENPFAFAVQSNTYLTKEHFINESKYLPDANHIGPDGNGHHQKRDRSLTKKYVAADEDEYKMKELESAYIHEIHNKKMKKRIRQMMNLECKTVSIVGIPSQLRESTIFNETQTTTSLNVINQVEDFIEKKKQSKRFKLYYKYSVADNKCPNDSDKSSEGKKSIISDSHRVISDPSDHNIDIWEDVQEEPVDVSKDSANEDMGNILFIMKNKKLQKHGIGTSGKHNSMERPVKKFRKRSASPKTSMLNNILEEPSNISIVVHHNESPSLLNEDLDCTFFNLLNSSSSNCDIEMVKKNERGSATHKQKTHRAEKHIKEATVKHRSPSRRDHEKDHQRDVKVARKPKCEEKYEYPKKIRKMESQQKIKKKPRSNSYKFNSKSDINISYDSLTKYKPKRKPKIDAHSNFKEELKHLLPELPVRKSSPERKSFDQILKEGNFRKELKHLLPELPVRKPSPERKSFDQILKEELRQILKEIPRSMACKETSFDDLSQVEQPKSANKCTEEETNDIKVPDVKEPNENQTIQQEPKDLKVAEDKQPDDDRKCQKKEEKKFCSKKIGTHQPMTKIPSLIRGYIAKTFSQTNNSDVIENHPPIDEINQAFDQQEDIEQFEASERGLVDTAVEVDISEDNLNEEDPTDITLGNKMSQTPTPKVDMGIEVEMDITTRNKTSKKASGSSKVKRCQILDPYTNTKLGCTIKPTRPIINLENNHFPSRKVQESSDTSRPPSSQYKRQKSNMSEGKTVKFERRDEFQEERKKSMKQRPTSVEKEAPSKPQRIPTKSALTMSTKVITINSPAYTEKCSEEYNEQTKSNKRHVVNSNINKKYAWEKRASTAGYDKRRQDDISSKSALSLNDVESRIGSMVCVDKFSNYHKLNLNSNSNSRSLDQYAMKSIITDNPQSSRLFLTKNFNTKMNTYQRRKMYDEGIRKKMRKKYGNQMGPGIYEVRYLTLENENDNPDSNQTSSHRCLNRFPTFNTKMNKPRQRSKACKPSAKKSRKNFPTTKEDACKFSGRDIFAPLISDVDQLNRFRRKAFPEKNVEEIFVKKSSPNDKEQPQTDVQSSSTDEKFVSSEHLNPAIINKENVDQNFKELIDCLYNSIITYCNSKFKLPQQEVIDSEQKGETARETSSIKSPPPINEVSYVVFPKSPRAKGSNQPITDKSSSSERNVSTDEGQSQQPTNLVCEHLSCPVLTGSTSSFDYLYEDGSIELNKEAVLLHFRKPMKTILGYALNNTHHIPKQALPGCHKKEDQISNSATESEESGYSSNNSKKCASVCSFFKKPSIVNLFKPVRRLEGGFRSTASSVADSRSGANLQEYDVMTQRCKEYAEKVREQSQRKDEPMETFQEIPLDVLLFCKKSCTRLDDFNSNCSLCKKHSNSDLPDITELDEHSNTMESLHCHLETKDSLNSLDREAIVTLSEGKINSETSLFDKDLDQRPSLEMISFQKSETNLIRDSLLMKEITLCPVVLSITNLNTCSLTVIEESSTEDKDDIEDIESDEMEKNSVHGTDIKEDYSKTDSKSSSPIDYDGRSDISSNSGFRNTYSVSATSKYMAKKFFDSLLKVYEKEMTVTNKLFQDEEFFSNILLESIKCGEITKTKNTRLKKLIKGKIKNCIGNVFSSKNDLDHQVNEIGSQNTSSTSNHQRKLQILASDARQYFSMFVQAVKTNKDINDEVKMCGLLKLLERIQDGDFTVLRRKEDVDFEEEIRDQVKEAFVNIYQISVKEAKKKKRSLTSNDLKLIRTFVSKYRIGLLSKTDLIASYIGRGVFKTEGHLKAAVTYLIQHNKNKDIDLKDFDQHCKILQTCST